MTDLMLPLALLDNIGHIVLVAIGVGLLIFIHELGHFLAARWAGARIDAFSLGFGPVLIGVKRGETEYRLSAIPLGGYVKFAGENPGEGDEDDPRNFQNLPIYKRAIVAVAGPFSNFILSFVCFSVALYFGVKVIPPIVGEVVPGMPAAEAGLEPGDRIVRVNGNRVIDFGDDLVQLVAINGVDEPLTMEVKRDGQTKTFEMTPVAGHPQAMASVPSIGIRQPFEPDPDGPAARAGFRRGDRVIAVNGEPIESHLDLPEALAGVDSGRVVLTVRRKVDGETRTVDLDPIVHQSLGITWTGEGEHTIGQVMEDTPAARAGFEEGDVVTSIDDKTFPSMIHVTRYIRQKGTKPLVVKVKRGEKTLTFEVTPEMNEKHDKPMIGVSFAGNPPSNVVEAVEPGSPAAERGIEKGDTVVKIALAEPLKDADVDASGDDPNGKEDDPYRETPVTSGLLVEYFIDSYGGRPVTLTLADDETVTVDPMPAGSGVTTPRNMLGIDTIPVKETTPELSAGEALTFGYKRMWLSVVKVGGTIKQLVAGGVSPKLLGGPIQIAQSSYASSKVGATRLLYWLAFIGVNLGVLNLLPVPILDGGMLVMLGLEGVMGRKPPEKLVMGAQVVGLVLLLSLMAFVMFNDVVRLFS
jgi:regulator of sigma E protease